MTVVTPRSPSTPEEPKYPQTRSGSSSLSQPRKSNGERLLQFTGAALIFGNIDRAWYYCKACHEDVKHENQIKKCKCKNCKYKITF